MSSDIPRVVYQPSPSISRSNRKQYAASGSGNDGRHYSQSRENDGSIGTITTKPEGESVVGRYYRNNESGEKRSNNNENNDGDEPLNQSRSFGASSRRLAARNQAKANYRASAAAATGERSSSQPPPRQQRDEENARQHGSYAEFQSHASPSRNPSMAKQPQYQRQQEQQQNPRPSYPDAGDQQPPQRQHMERPPQGQQQHHHQRPPPPPIKANTFQPGAPASSAPSTPQNHAVRTPLSPRSPNLSPGATSPRDYNMAPAGNTNGSISRMVNQTVASSPVSSNTNQGARMPTNSPNLKSSSTTNKGIASIDPQSIQQSNTTFTHILTQLSNLNQSGRYLSAHDLLVQSTTSEQRAVLWPILKHKVETLPTFPEAGEDDGLCLLRESERVFGPSFKKLVEIEGKANGGNAGPSLVDGMMSPMSGTAGGVGLGEEQQQQPPSDQLQQGQYEGQRQGQGQYQEHQDQGYQHGEEEYSNYQRQDYNNDTEQYYDERGHQPHQQSQQREQYGNNSQGHRVNDEREAFDYSRMDDSHKERGPTRNGNQHQWQHEGGRQYVPPSFHETDASERGGGPDRFREQNGHRQWNGPSSSHGDADRFGSSEGSGARPGYQEHHRSHQNDHHLSTRHEHDRGSHYTNYRVDNGYQRQDNEDDTQQSVHNDAHSVRSRFSKASRSMFAQTFDEEYEFNAKRRQELFEEMEHTSRILRSTTNEDVRRSHVRHLKNLREEWEQLKGLASPTKSTLETNTVRTNAERSTKSSAANTSSSSRRASRDKKVSKKLWRGEQILLRDPNDGHGGGIPDDKSIGLKSARSMATNARSIFDDDAKSVATAPASRPMGKRTVNVVAPETLPAGFAFEARLGDHVFMATVPEGGVAKGEVFASVINDIDEGADKASVRVRTLLDMGGPKNRWRDELLDCFTEGFFHPLICNSIFCPQVALTQIMARMQMTSVGERGITLNSRFKVKQALWLTIGVVLVHVLYAVPIVVRSPQNVTLYALSFLPLMAMDLGLVFYFWYLVARTRKAMRDEYEIPQIHCKCGCGAEDACMAVFCSACTLAQMGRHTADYTTYRAMCCSDTGLPNHVEVKLPSDPMNEMV